MLSTHSATNSPATIHHDAMNSESSTSSTSLPNIAISSRLSPRKRNLFHLRRHMKDVRFTRDMEVRMYNLFKQYSPYPPKSVPESDPAYLIARENLISRATTILLDKVTRFGRNPEVVDVVLHSDQQGQMVSRLHAEITAEQDSEDPTRFVRYSIADRSLNGTYVNDRRAPTVSGELYLKKGDIIKFGHVNGASYKPGEYAIGNESEFIFTFEPAFEGMEYIGHTPDGNRIERKGPQAYIHLGAHSLLPHEFDLFSLVPKREADLSVIPYGARINPEQKRVEYIQPHSQLVTKTDNSKPSEPGILHPGTFGSAAIPIPGVSNPAIIPNMTNFNFLTDLARLSAEIQPHANVNNNGHNEMMLNLISQLLKSSPLSPELLYLLQLLQVPQQQLQQLQPMLSYFQQPIVTSNSIHNINLALQANLLRPYMSPSETAFRQIATPFLNGHTSLNNVNGIPSGSGANVMQALCAALQPTTVASSIASAVVAASMAATASASTPTTSTMAAPTTSNHHHHHQQQQQFTSPIENFTRQMLDAKRKHEHVESSPDNIASASSTTSEETITTTSCRNPASDLLYHDSIVTPQRFSTQVSEIKPEKISINEKTIVNVAKAAAAAAVENYRSSGEVSDRKIDMKPIVKTPTPPTRAKTTSISRKQRKANIKGDHNIQDHIQETIDFVANQTTEKPSDGEFTDHLSESFTIDHLNEPIEKQRKRKKKLSENENGKHKENVLKILDDAVAKMEPEKPKLPTFKVELHDSEPSTTNGTTHKSEAMIIDREQSSSGGSLIVCEARADDPGLVNGSNVDLLEAKKPEELNKLLNRRLSGGSKGRKKKSSETESDSDEDILEIYKQATRKQQHSNESASSDTRPRKKSTSVKSRVIRVPRSPIPSYKKGPERLPGHKSNEVARLLYDLEGSYMHVARKGVTKRVRKNTGDDKRNDSDEETDDEEEGESRPSSSHHVPTKRKSTERFSETPPPKKSKDSQERENDSDNEKTAVSSDEEEQIVSPPPKVNGNESKKAKKSKDSDSKPTPKPRKNAKKHVEIEENNHHDNESQKSDSDSEDEEEEPTPKRRRGGKSSKKETTKTPTIQKKKPGRQPKFEKEAKPKKKPGRKAKDKNTFVELTNNEWEKCAFPACKHPKIETTVNWVQCDDCDQWYHILCAFGRDDKTVLEEQFHCGCLTQTPTATPQAVMA
jgi:hypothetical protein